MLFGALNSWFEKWMPSINVLMFLASISAVYTGYVAIKISNLANQGAEAANKIAQNNTERNINIASSILKVTRQLLNLVAPTPKPCSVGQQHSFGYGRLLLAMATSFNRIN